MKKVLIIGIFLMITIGATIGVASDKIEAYLVNYQVYYTKGAVNDNLRNPLISYNDHTYMSLQDVADWVKKDVQWNEQYKKVNFVALEQDKEIIKNTETAEKIAKAMIEDYYSDKINGSTLYETVYSEPTAVWADRQYVTFVLINPLDDMDLTQENIMYYADIQVYINSIDGSIGINEKQEDGSMKPVVNQKRL